MHACYPLSRASLGLLQLHVVAYVMACYNGKGVEFEEGLRLVQEQRKMAEPNPTFIKLLQSFGKSNTLRQLRETLN